MADTLLDEVKARHKWLKDKWVTKAADAHKIYLGEKADETPFNILYSNTEVIVPAVFSQVPIPVVQRRHGEMKHDTAAKAAERFLSYVMDTNIPGEEAFQDSVECAVLDTALAGQGQCWLDKDAATSLPVFRFIPYDQFIWGYGRKWAEVQWVGRIHHMTRKDILATFKKETAEYSKWHLEGCALNDETGAPETEEVFEVFDKRTKKRYYLIDDGPEDILFEEDDPYQLTGFFPCPQPLNFIVSTTDMLPRMLYTLYKHQAEELNNLTRRIKAVTSAIKIRGLYNGNLKELADVFSPNTQDNQLIAAEQPALLARDGGLANQIWLVPVEKLAAVLQVLLQARESVKGTIFEILGIGDILRGTSKASETFGAQQLKDKWGSLRINKVRNKTARFIRDLLRLALEMGAKHTPSEQWGPITGLELLPELEASLMPPGQAPQETWTTVLGLLRTDVLRSYAIDIEANSSVDSEATQEKADLAEFMNAFGQTMTALQPLAQGGPEGFKAAQAIVIEVCKRFRMGPEVQKILLGMQPPEPAGPPPEVLKQMQEQKSQLEARAQKLQQSEQALQQKQDQLAGVQRQVESSLHKLKLAEQELSSSQKIAAQETAAQIRQIQAATQVPVKAKGT